MNKSREKELAQVVEMLAEEAKFGNVLPRSLEELQDSSVLTFTVDRDGEIVGCACLDIYSSKLAEIRSLVVKKKYRGMGLGKQLVRQCVKAARDHGIRDVMAFTHSPEVFESAGFDSVLGGQRVLFLKP